MAFIHYRTKVFVFKKSDRSEADRIFTIFSKDFGRLEILAKAIRKITSKLRQGIELFYLSEIEFIQGKTYKTLTDAIVIEKFENFRKDLEKLKIAFKISEILDNFLKFEEKDEKIWNLIIETFNRLNNPRFPAPSKNNHFFYGRGKSGYFLDYYYFLWNFFSLLGYTPELYHCSICQKKITPLYLYFSPKEGGVICQHCAKKESKKETIEINANVVKILRIILKNDWQTLTKLKITPASQKLLKNISENYYYFLRESFSYDIIKGTYER